MANVESLTEHLAATKVLPLYTAIDMSLLDPLEELLIKHDIRLIEVTFRSELALKATLSTLREVARGSRYGENT